MPSNALGQTASNVTLYNWFDSITPNSNKTISNGYEYIEKYRVINDKHPYFKSPNFKLSTLTYKDQPFFNVNLKFNLYEQELIIVSPQKENRKILVLDNNLVNDFKIEDHCFEKIDFKSSNKRNDNIFYEVIVSKKDVKLYKRHSKKMKKKNNENTVFYEFFNSNSYYLFKNNSLIKIESIGTFKSIYPDKKQIINLFINKTSKKANKELDYKNLLLELI